VTAQKTRTRSAQDDDEAAVRAADRGLGAGAWSYFGDPRAIAHNGHTFTG
jgi:hypothetical protein